MADERRHRKPSHHERALAFLVDTAEGSSEKLIQIGNDPELSRTIQGTLPFSIRTTVGEALSAAADQVMALASISAWDSNARPTLAEETQRVIEIEGLGRKLSGLALEARTRTVALGEFEEIRAKLMDLGFAMKTRIILDVADVARR